MRNQKPILQHKIPQFGHFCINSTSLMILMRKECESSSNCSRRVDWVRTMMTSKGGCRETNLTLVAGLRSRMMATESLREGAWAVGQLLVGKIPTEIRWSVVGVNYVCGSTDIYTVTGQGRTSPCHPNTQCQPMQLGSTILIARKQTFSLAKVGPPRRSQEWWL